MKIQHDDVILRYITLFSYIFPYYDVIDRNADVSKNNDVILKAVIANKCSNVTLLLCNTPPPSCITDFRQGLVYPPSEIRGQKSPPEIGLNVHEDFLGKKTDLLMKF